jgi:hypothetical protein
MNMALVPHDQDADHKLYKDKGLGAVNEKREKAEFQEEVEVKPTKPVGKK